MLIDESKESVRQSRDMQDSLMEMVEESLEAGMVGLAFRE